MNKIRIWILRKFIGKTQVVANMDFRYCTCLVNNNGGFLLNCNFDGVIENKHGLICPKAEICTRKCAKRRK